MFIFEFLLYQKVSDGNLFYWLSVCWNIDLVGYRYSMVTLSQETTKVIHVLQALLFSGSLFSISCISFCQPYKVCIVFFYHSIHCIYFVI